MLKQHAILSDYELNRFSGGLSIDKCVFSSATKVSLLHILCVLCDLIKGPITSHMVSNLKMPPMYANWSGSRHHLTGKVSVKQTLLRH